jgi:hypothetical protein
MGAFCTKVIRKRTFKEGELFTRDLHMQENYHYPYGNVGKTSKLKLLTQELFVSMKHCTLLFSYPLPASAFQKDSS